MRLRMALCREIPADFIAANSYCSAKLPNVIIDDNRMVNGRTIGMRFGSRKNKNLDIMSRSISFPANSSINLQTDWRMKINISIVKTEMKVFTKEVKM